MAGRSYKRSKHPTTRLSFFISNIRGVLFTHKNNFHLPSKIYSPTLKKFTQKHWALLRANPFKSILSFSGQELILILLHGSARIRPLDVLELVIRPLDVRELVIRPLESPCKRTAGTVPKRVSNPSAGNSVAVNVRQLVTVRNPFTGSGEVKTTTVGDCCRFVRWAAVRLQRKF